MTKTHIYIPRIRLIILTLLLLTARSAYTLEPETLAEAENLEIIGDTLSAELEYCSILEDCITEYGNSIDKASNLATAEFLLEKIIALSGLTGEIQDPLQLLEKLKAKDLPEPLLTRIALARIQLYKRLGDAAKVRSIADNLGFISTLTLQFQDNGTIAEISSIAPDYLLPLGQIFSNSRDSELTASLTLYSAEPRAIALHFGSSTPINISLNSQEIIRTTADRYAIADQQAIGLSLQKGENLLQINCRLKPTTALYLRLTTPEGKPLKSGDIQLNRQKINSPEKLAQIQQKTAKTTAPVFPAINTGAEQYFAGRFQADKSNDRIAYFLGYLLLTRSSLADSPQAARSLLLDAARNNPDNVIYLMAIAEANDESKRFVADREENMRRMSLEKAITLDPENILARAELADYYLHSQNSPERAEEFISQALKINPSAVVSNLVLYDIYMNRGWKTRALQIARDMVKRDPQNPKAQRILGLSGMENTTINEALSAFKAAYTQDATSNSTASNIFRLLLRTGDTAAAEDFAEKHLKLNPYYEQLRKEYIEMLLTDNSPKTLTAIETARRIFPNNSSFTRLLGDYYATIQNDTAKALTCYQQALKYNPANVELEKYLQFHGIIRQSPLKQIPDLQEYVSGINKDRIPPGTDRIYILNEKYDKLNPGGTSSRTVHLIIQVFSRSAAEVFKRYPIWYDKDTEQTDITTARVMHQDGSTSLAQSSGVRQRGNRGITVVDFPALDSGDILELEYTIAQTRANFFGSYFGNINLFSNTLPILESRYTITAPANRKLYFHRSPSVPEPVITENNGDTTYTWSMQDLPAITLSPNSPPITELSPVLEVSTFKDWDTLARWYWELIRDQNIPTPEIAAKVKELTLNAHTDREKLAAIYNWVTTEIRNNAWEFGVHGFKPYNAGTIFTRRFGDCKDKATLINVMAKLAGIDAWPLLLRSTQSNNSVQGRGREDFKLPLLSHFNHCISYIDLDGDPYYLDGTMMFRTIDSRPTTDAGASAVIIRPDGAEMTATPPYSGDSNRWIDYTGIGLNAEGTADMDFTIATTGDSSMYLRAWFSNHQTWDNVLKAICTERYGHVSAVVVEEFGSNAELDKDEEMLKGRVRIRNYAKKSDDGKITFKIPTPLLSQNSTGAGSLPAELSGFALTSRRSTDLLLPALYKIERHLKIEWAPGWELAEKLPEDIEIDTSFGHLSISFSLINNILKLDYIMELKETRISSAQYSEFRDFCIRADYPVRTSFTLHPAE